VGDWGTISEKEIIKNQARNGAGKAPGWGKDGKERGGRIRGVEGGESGTPYHYYRK